VHINLAFELSKCKLSNQQGGFVCLLKTSSSTTSLKISSGMKQGKVFDLGILNRPTKLIGPSLGPKHWLQMRLANSSSTY
jgi:hypothetical protein